MKTWLVPFVSACGLISAACSPSAPAPQAPPSPAFELATPAVTMQADPPPPFTYWAPEGATITNHPDVPGIWFAELNGQRVGTYFGDECRASEFQQIVGEPLSAMTPAPDGVEVRTSCTNCEVDGDLRRNRINVIFDEPTQRIEQIACY